MGNNASQMAQEAMGATKKAQMVMGSGLQSMNRCISKQTGEQEDASMSAPQPCLTPNLAQTGERRLVNSPHARCTLHTRT
jgi:hypothetical protein